MTTLKEIAQKSGVSTTTVSLVLNGRQSRISEETKKRILAIANELDYQPNQLAVALATKKTKILGIIIPSIGSIYHSKLAEGLEKEVRKHGYNVIFTSINENTGILMEQVKILLSRKIDGLVIVYHDLVKEGNYSKEITKALKNASIPVVAVDGRINTPLCDHICFDDRVGGYMATEHLIRLGHKKIGFISGPMEFTSATERFSGYREALKDNHIHFQNDMVHYGSYDIAAGIEGGKKLISKGATAIFACSDMAAYGVYRQANLLGLDIPRQLSIIGYDNIEFSKSFLPLTTIDQPAAEIGKKAGQMILGHLLNEEDGFEAEHFIFMPNIVVRETTANLEETQNT